MNGRIKKMHNKIRSIRNCGIATCKAKNDMTTEIENTDLIIKKLDLFVESIGFTGLGEDWAEVDLNLSIKILTEIIRNDMAYKHPLTSSKTAKKLASEFIAIFEKPFRFFTNGNLFVPAIIDGVKGEFFSISESTFDSGIVCIDCEKIGILWVQDED